MDILKNKVVKSYDYLSRYANIPSYYHSKDNRHITGTSKNLDKNTPYSTYVVQRNDTLDSLAFKFYKNPTYYWIIGMFNDISNPFVKLEEGALIKIPSISTIKFDSDGRY